MELKVLREELWQKKIGIVQSESQHENVQYLLQHEDNNTAYIPRI